MSHPAPVIELVQPLSVGERTLAEMRAMFGRNTTAYRWSQLPVKTRERICLAARLPAEACRLALDKFEKAQQEEIHLALRDLMPAFHVFGGTALGRREWYCTNRPSIPQRAQVAPTNTPPEPASRDDLLARRKALIKKYTAQSDPLPEPQALYDEE